MKWKEGFYVNHLLGLQAHYSKVFTNFVLNCLKKCSFPKNRKIFAETTLTQCCKKVVRHFVILRL